jgi:endonuclease/exonuclease/phosphatase family metal-dependent hydrolase
VVASYNVRRCLGLDGRRDPDRVAAVISEMKADVVGLQEVESSPDSDPDGVDQLALLARKSGLHALAGPILRRHDGHTGNGLLTRLPIRSYRLLDLSVPGREPRGAIDVTLEGSGARMRLLVTHFGLRGAERRAQAIRLLSALEDRSSEDVTVLLGDLNEWFPRGRMLRSVGRGLAEARSVRSFPAFWPVLALDRICVAPAGALREFGAHVSPLARVASDHLPVRAVIALPACAPHVGPESAKHREV